MCEGCNGMEERGFKNCKKCGEKIEANEYICSCGKRQIDFWIVFILLISVYIFLCAMVFILTIAWQKIACLIGGTLIIPAFMHFWDNPRGKITELRGRVGTSFVIALAIASVFNIILYIIENNQAFSIAGIIFLFSAVGFSISIRDIDSKSNYEFQVKKLKFNRNISVVIATIWGLTASLNFILFMNTNNNMNLVLFVLSALCIILYGGQGYRAAQRLKKLNELNKNI